MAIFVSTDKQTDKLIASPLAEYVRTCGDIKSEVDLDRGVELLYMQMRCNSVLVGKNLMVISYVAEVGYSCAGESFSIHYYTTGRTQHDHYNFIHLCWCL
jgi:hypothetical protein